MINNENVQILEKEWSGGVLLNPFAVIEQMINDNKPKLKASNGPKRALAICEEIADLFLRCTDYLAEQEDEELKRVEKSFLTAMLLYLYTEAPADEQSMCMMTELIRADDPGNSEYHQSDLDRVFKLLGDKNESHPALTEYKRYQKSGTLRKTAYYSVRRRFRPLIALTSGDEENLFGECSKCELFELAAAMMQNCVGFPEEPRLVYSVVNETIFTAAALAYLMIGFEEKEQTSPKLFEILGQPEKYASKITAVLRAASADTFPDLQEVIEYWFKHSEKAIAAGNYKKDRLNGAARFFREFK